MRTNEPTENAVGCESPVLGGGGFGHFYSYAPTNFEYAIDRFTMETKRQLDVLDKQLEGGGRQHGDTQNPIPKTS